ncbi:RidA family protein [Gordonia sp. HY002]|uniref:RidA family protein n=1 Tax=Gordonia zhenghanii TaxID=2911516 RepID=UPI001EF12FB0|nr:RidA family protein [Gordonia zhenghanii]MCF8570981.1 RidA family protein [Gordonia zhenghanii]MCF8604724.1 RidA family protein [Gordonia zhenghanii]
MRAEPVPGPQGRYVPVTRSGSTIRTAGMTPRRDGRLVVTGRVGESVEIPQAREAAGLAARNAIAAARSVVTEGERLTFAEMTVYIACSSDFTELSAVADGASDAAAEEVGANGLPARSAVGVYALPGGSPVEVALVAEVVTT